MSGQFVEKDETIAKTESGSGNWQADGDYSNLVMPLLRVDNSNPTLLYYLARI